MEQDPGNPHGVSGGDHQRKALGSARARKANAAIQMRLAGATWHEIAVALGYPTERQALVSTERALVKQLETNDDREKMRRIAGARLERLLRGVWPKAINPDDPDHLVAVGKARDIIDRHAKLFGLDAPQEIVVHTPTATELEAWVAKVVSIQHPEALEYDILDGEIVEDAG